MNQTSVVASAAAPGLPPVAPAQYLTFVVGSDAFAIPVSEVKEIIGYTTITEVPAMPPYVRGVINLRGAVVPTVDLSLRLGRQAGVVGKRTCIVIISAGFEGARQDVGLIVDAVSAVVEVSAAEIEPPPRFGANVRSEFVAAMLKLDARLVISLALDRLLTAETWDQATQSAPQPEA